MKSNKLLLALGLIVLIAQAGCIFSPDDDNTGPTDPPEDEYPFPESANQLMLNFQAIHSAMDFTNYREILDDEYKFIMLPETVHEIGHPQDYLTREEDLDGAENMFNAISEFEMILTGEGSWERESESHEYFPGAERRVYGMHAELFDPNSGTRYIVDGLVTFYVSSTLVDVEGVETPMYKLLGQHDHTAVN